MQKKHSPSAKQPLKWATHKDPHHYNSTTNVQWAYLPVSLSSANPKGWTCDTTGSVTDTARDNSIATGKEASTASVIIKAKLIQISTTLSKDLYMWATTSFR